MPVCSSMRTERVCSCGNFAGNSDWQVVNEVLLLQLLLWPVKVLHVCHAGYLI